MTNLRKLGFCIKRIGLLIQETSGSVPFEPESEAEAFFSSSTLGVFSIRVSVCSGMVTLMMLLHDEKARNTKKFEISKFDQKLSKKKEEHAVCYLGSNF